ncbi:hypothetical protein GAR06_04134 [Micromonospora saelicesensis]|nr:hypothetical protein GAR06_04134 [Micromonospora saelicesensis]
MTGCEPGGDYLLAPDLRWVGIESKTNLFAQLSPQGGQWRLAVFDATAGSDPDSDRASRIGNGESEQQNMVVFIDDYRTRRSPQVHRRHQDTLRVSDHR